MNKALIAVLGISTAAFALPAASQGMSAVYIGGGLGQSKFTKACDDVPAGVTCDDKDTSFKLFGGYQFNKNFAAELGYSDLGKAKFTDPTGSAELSATVWELSAVGSWPLADAFSIFGRLGGYWGETKFSGDLSGKKSTTNLTYGLGAQYDFMKNFGVRGEWQRYTKLKAQDDAPGSTESDSDADVFGISVLYRFQ